MHHYRVVDVLNVVDGDTIDCILSLGFGITAAFRFRVASVDTPEMRGPRAEPAGVEARTFTVQWFEERAGRLSAQTFKGAQATVGIGDGAFGRWLAEFTDDATGEALSDALHNAGFHR